MEGNKILTTKKIIEITNGKLLSGKEDTIVEKFSIDTRIMEKGDMFVEVEPNLQKENPYIEIALENGAVGVMIERNLDDRIIQKYKNKIIIQVQNSVLALQKLATYKREQYNIPVIAITGSVGKTSTKDIVANVISQKYNVLKTQGNYNNHIGVPLTLLRLKDHTAVVIEMGMNHFGEISVLTKIAKPTTCIITNVGTAHIGNLGSRENILKAKLEILEGLQENGSIIINNDNDLLHKWEQENNKYKVITYGIENKSNYEAYNINSSENGSTYNIKIKEKTYTVKVPVGGNHFIYNSLCAISAGLIYNIEIEKILYGIENFELTKRRMEVEKINDVTIINDAYNASYDSMKPALEYLKDIKGNRKIAVLGDMLELGEFSKELHEKVGEEVVKNNIDILITVGELSKYIAKKAINLNMEKENVYICENTEEAVKEIKELWKKDDVILLKASNGMKFDKILERIR